MARSWYYIWPMYVYLLMIICFLFLFSVTLHDIVHTDKALTLVFEYLERDLKQYMDDCGGILSMNNVKVSGTSLKYIQVTCCTANYIPMTNETLL